MTKHLLVLGLSVSATVSLAANLTLNQLQKSLVHRGATWTAESNRVSNLNDTEKKNLFGLQLDEGFQDVFKAPQNKERVQILPSKFDWRNKDGVNYSSPILNQANCGSCVAFSAIGALETQMNIERKTPNSPWSFSPQHLFSCGGGACQQGWHPMMAVMFLQRTGVPDETCFPYTSGGDGKDLACSQTCSDANNRSLKISGYSQPSFFIQDAAAVKEALMKGPLMTTMMVYEDFLFYKSGVYKHSEGEQLGGHAITLVGWDDEAKAWILRNSWGEEWGEKGYFRVAYDDTSGIANQTWGLQVPSSKGFVTLGGLRDYDVLSGKVELKLESTVSGTKTVDVNVKSKDRSIFWTSGRNGDRIVVDTTKFADGVYTVLAQADTSTGMVLSQPRTLYILNGPHSGSVQLMNLSDGETLTDGKELDIQTTGSPVPYTSIKFKAVNLKTGAENVRSTYTVLPSMKMLWRAQYLENGDYRVTVEAKVGDKVTVETKPITVKISH